MDPLLTVRGLCVGLKSDGRTKDLVEDVHFDLFPGELLVVVGESGSGKTTLCRALTKLFPPTWKTEFGGQVLFDGVSLLAHDEAALAEHRRNSIRYIFQQPKQALNPLARICSQMANARTRPSKGDRDLREMLARVGLHDAEEILHAYPHELSVGMAQRVLIAMATLGRPKLIIADEPTSAVDVSLKFQLLDCLQSIQRAERMAMILVTHDLEIARRHGDRILVLYAGRVIESASRDEFFRRPLHPYSRILLEVHERMTVLMSSQVAVEVDSSTLEASATGCKFSPRCPHRQTDCTDAEPRLERVEPSREVRCLHWK